MITFLTSSPTMPLHVSDQPLFYEKNGFVDQLKELWPDQARCLMIAAFPDRWEANDEMTGFYCAATVNSGLPVACFDLWDDRCPGLTVEEVHSYDVIFLAGGHVPTERRWFEYIQLRGLLEDYEGIVIGTSAGSMNCAEEVYAWPELKGESRDPGYELFFPGLGLARANIMPHYQKVRYAWLDGRRLVDGIARSHSKDRRFFILPDGSFIRSENGEEAVFGSAWIMENGRRKRFCYDGECRDCWDEVR